MLGDQTEDTEDSETLIQAITTLLEHYFSLVKDVFEEDWGNPNSLLMCAKYFGTFIRLLETFTITEDQLTLEKIKTELENIKRNILDKYNKGRSSNPNLVFDPDAYCAPRENLPSKRGGSIKDIHDLLNGNR